MTPNELQQMKSAMICHGHGTITDEEFNAVMEKLTGKLGAKFPRRIPLCPDRWHTDPDIGPITPRTGAVTASNGRTHRRTRVRRFRRFIGQLRALLSARKEVVGT